MLRGSGVAWDLRRAQPYDVYDQIDFDVPIGKNGDCWDRYLVRMEEMRQSLRIIRQCLAQMPAGPGQGQRPQGHAAAARRDEAVDGSADPSFQALHRGLSRAGRRDLHGRSRRRKASSASISSSDGSNRPYRCKIRAPGFAFLQATEFMSKGHMLADVVAIIGSMDIVFGEIDR